MKKSGRPILVLTVIALLVLAVGAYILLFHTNVPIEQYLSRGENAMARGNYNSAIRNYENALKLAEADPQISLSLSNAYKAAGNYTKAEYTLVSAISENPEQTPLYVALSRVYVEQEKFLDADLLLSRAANEAVKAELESLRPAAPSLTPEPGYYSDYITLTATCVAGRIFLTTDGAYPSNAGDLYTGPKALEQGETIVYALTVDDSGLVSPIVCTSYTIAGIVEPITLTDSSLDTLVRGVLGKAPEDEILTSELWEIESLELTGNIRDLSQLVNFIGLKDLKIGNIPATDLSCLSSLPALTKLDLSDRVLSAANMKTLSELTKLLELDLGNCAVIDISLLSNLKKLTKLDLSNNVITDLMPLTQMNSLTELSLRNNPIASLQPLQYCLNLQVLDLSACKLTDISHLGTLDKLVELDLSDNNITSIAALEKCTALQELNIAYNKVGDCDILKNFKELTVLEASHNSINALPAFPADAKLRSIDLSYNSLTSVESMKNLQSLNFLNIDYNKVKDLSPLTNCHVLVQVDAWNNPVNAGISALNNMGVILNYNPNYS